jgi:hypothetical protein
MQNYLMTLFLLAHTVLVPTAVRCAETAATARSRLFVANRALAFHRHFTTILSL